MWFYEKLSGLLREAGVDHWIEGLCEEFYCDRGRGSVPPGRYFRMLFVGYFEGIDSQRGIAWRCDDRLSLKVFLGLEAFDEAPDHSSLTKIVERLPAEVYREVFQFALRRVHERGLLKGRTVGMDTTLLEANAAMKSIVRNRSCREHARPHVGQGSVSLVRRTDKNPPATNGLKNPSRCGNVTFKSGPHSPNARREGFSPTNRVTCSNS